MLEPGHFASKLTHDGGSARLVAPPSSSLSSAACALATVIVAQAGIDASSVANVFVMSLKHASSSPTVAMQVLSGAEHVLMTGVVSVGVQLLSAALHAICAAASVEAVAASSTASELQVKVPRSVENAPLVKLLRSLQS
jgi:hypothetical protein